MVVVGIDSSTQSTKALVVDAEDGRVLAEGRAGHPEGTEVAPEAWWTACEQAVHHALAGIDAADVDISTSLPGGIRWPLPFYINGMTGGTETTGRVNAALAEAAAETGIAIATGSMSIYLRDETVLPTFRVLRDKNPRGFVMGNLSADATPDQARRVVDALE